MATEYAHTNLIAEDWERLVSFYCTVFDCEQVGVARDLEGQSIDQASGRSNAHLKGVHLRLPGFAENAPTLEIYSYSTIETVTEPPSNRKGFGHIAFRVDDVDSTLAKVVEHGGRELGKPLTIDVSGAGRIRWVYARDPEGNIVELQKWE